MLIDWFTVIAQIANFLILVWLLKRFLYQPILDAIDARENRIAKELLDAASKQTEALQERNIYQLKNEEFDRQRSTLMNQAQEEAKKEKGKLLDAARQEADYLSARRHEALQSEHQSLNASLIRSTRAEVFSIARKTLLDLADASLEARMVDVFLQRLRALNQEEVNALKTAFKATDKTLLIRSVYELPASLVTEISSTIEKVIGCNNPIQFEMAPNIVSGIELICNGHKVTWSIEGYLSSMEKSIGSLLNSQTKSPENMAQGTAPK
jgi:F-type H+-transporting ATPase subunit b